MLDRILYIVLSSHIAGTEKHVLDLISNIKNDYEPVLVSYGGDFSEQAERSKIKCYVLDNNKIKMIYQLYRVINEVKPKIVHAHLGKSGLYGRIVAFFARVPVIIYTDHAWGQKNTDLSVFANYIHIVIYRLLAKITNKIIAISIPVKKYLINEVKIPKEKVVCIENGINLKLFPENMEKERKNIISFICVGRLEKEKNQICLLKAAKELRDIGYTFEVEIIGEGSQENSLKYYCKKNNMSNYVKFLGYIPNDELYKYYLHADVLVLPSLRETFGLVLLEAMACYCPCIGSNVGGIPFIINEGVNGYIFDVNDYKTLTEKMEKIINNRDILFKLSTNARRIVCEKFSSERMVKDTENVYLEELKKCDIQL